MHNTPGIIVSLHRIQSRAIVVPFRSPSVGPDNTIEDQQFEELEHALGSMQYSSCIGWIVSLAKSLKTQGVLQEKEKFRDCFTSRQAANLSILLFFLKEVSNHVYIPYCYTAKYQVTNFIKDRTSTMIDL